LAADRMIHDFLVVLESGLDANLVCITNLRERFCCWFLF